MTGKTKLKLLGVLCTVILIVVLVLQNTDSVETRILFFTFTLPSAFLIVISFGAGVVVGLLIAFLVASKIPKSD